MQPATMTKHRSPLRSIAGNSQKTQKTQSFEDRVKQFFNSARNTVVSEILSEVDHPFIIPLELYLSAREPTVPFQGLDYLRNDPYNRKTYHYSSTVFTPARAEIAAMIYSSLGYTPALDVKLDWAYVEGSAIMPTVFIDVPPDTVTDWADLESGIRGILARIASKTGDAIDVQFRVKDGDTHEMDYGL